MKDEIAKDQEALDNVKGSILSDISSTGYANNGSDNKIHYNVFHPEKYSVSYIISQANNFIGTPQYKEDLQSNALQKGDLSALESSMQGFQSKLDTDKHDNTKVMHHMAHAYHTDNSSASELRNRIKQNMLSMSNWMNSGNYSNDKEVKDDKSDVNITSPSRSNEMATNVMKWSLYNQNVNDFIQKFQHPHKGYKKFTQGNQTFYFPSNLSWESSGMLYYLNQCDNKRQNYNNLTNNLYRTLWHQTYDDEDAVDTKIAVNAKSTLNDTNNHPVDNSGFAARQMANANTKYRYNVQKALIWEQYHQNKLDNMQDYANQLAADHNINIKNLVNSGGTTYTAKSGTTYIGLQAIYHIPWQQIAAANPKINAYHIPIGYRLNIPSHVASGHLTHIDKLIEAYSKGGKYYNMEIKLRNKWKNKADQLHNDMPSQQELYSEAYLAATEANINDDDRNGHYGYIRPVNPETDDSYVFFMVTDISPNHSTEASSNPIEWGRNITTGTQKQPTDITISGYLFNNDLPKTADNGRASQEPNDGHGLDPVKDDAQAISNWADAGAPVYFDDGIFTYPTCNITNWNPDFNLNGDGSLTTAQFSMEIQTADYFKSNTDGGSNGTGSAGNSTDHGSKPTNKGKASTKHNRMKYIIAKSGDTFCAIARKKHVSVGALEAANRGTSPTDIQIGQKIRIPK